MCFHNKITYQEGVSMWDPILEAIMLDEKKRKDLNKRIKHFHELCNKRTASKARKRAKSTKYGPKPLRYLRQTRKKYSGLCLD